MSVYYDKYEAENCKEINNSGKVCIAWDNYETNTLRQKHRGNLRKEKGKISQCHISPT